MIIIEGISISNNISKGEIFFADFNNFDLNFINSMEKKIILVMDKITKEIILNLNINVVKGIVTKYGTVKSQIAMIARNIGITYISNLNDGYSLVCNNEFAIIDGIDQCIICNPDRITLYQYEQKSNSIKKDKKRLKSLIGIKSKTKDNKRIILSSCIGNSKEIKTSFENDAENIGLFRTEYIFNSFDEYPDEESQFLIYKKILLETNNKKIVIRTMDLASDKQIGFFEGLEEQNPALGYKSIRISLDKTDLFVPQLRALYRASVFGNLYIAFPMITCEEELIDIFFLINNIKNDLLLENIEYSPNIKLGLIIETPASAIISDILSKNLDFFIINIHSLTQYTLAADRLNLKVNYLHNTSSVAIIRMVNYIVKTAKLKNIPVCICDEMVYNINLIEYYIGLDIDEICVLPENILKIKDEILKLNYNECALKVKEKIL